MPRFGVHSSIAGGLANAIEEAARLRCDCLQIFVRNQRQWKSPPLSDDQVRLFQAARSRRGLGPLIVHDNYLINLASPSPAGWRRSCQAFVDELDRCERLAAEFLVTHPGSHLGSGAAAGIARIVQALDQAVADRPGPRTTILLETTAGQGSSVGYRFEQLAEILGRLARPGFFGVCLDSCHVFAAGYDLRTAEAVGRTLDEFDRVVGLGRLRAIHLNDSKRALGSRVDRHEHIGRGQIGAAGFAAIVAEPRLADLPMILETPKGVDPAGGRDFDAVNLARLRRMARRAARRLGPD